MRPNWTKVLHRDGRVNGSLCRSTSTDADLATACPPKDSSELHPDSIAVTPFPTDLKRWTPALPPIRSGHPLPHSSAPQTWNTLPQDIQIMMWVRWPWEPWKVLINHMHYYYYPASSEGMMMMVMKKLLLSLYSWNLDTSWRVSPAKVWVWLMDGSAARTLKKERRKSFCCS